MPELIRAARGDATVDLLLTDARIVNVFSGEVITGHIAIRDQHVVGFGDYPARETVSVGGRYVAPGFIDAHVHIESAMTSVSEFVRAVLPHGTTGVVADPHEIANVMGMDGIAYMLSAAENQPMNIYFTLPSCVPATDMETAGATLDADTLLPLFTHEGIVGLGEMMNFPGIINGVPEVLKKVEHATDYFKQVDGHCPGLSGRDLSAYVAAGIHSDHECVRAEEAMEKLRLGMHIMIREGTGAKNLADLLPIVNPQTAGRIMWCTDDRHPHDIVNEGHIDYIIRKAVAAGLDPVTAIRMGTLNPARYFGLHRLGAIAPGRRADLVVLSDLEKLNVKTVYVAGRRVAEDGQVDPMLQSQTALECPSTMNIKTGALDFTIPAEGGQVRVIEAISGQIITRRKEMPAKVENGDAVADPSRDLIKIAVVERHKGTGNIGRGFVTGFGLKNGAIASSVAHDSHNIIVVGAADADMAAAVEAVAKPGGGLAVVSDGHVRALLPLPIAGLMSPDPIDAVKRRIDDLNHAAKDIGCILPDPFMTISFLALPVIPELRLTDKGLFDVMQFSHVPVFAGSL